MSRRLRQVYSVDSLGFCSVVAEALAAAIGSIGDQVLSLNVGDRLGRNIRDKSVTIIAIGIG